MAWEDAVSMACGDKPRRDSPELSIIFHCHSHLLSLTFTHFLPLLRAVGREQDHCSEVRDTQAFKAHKDCIQPVPILLWLGHLPDLGEVQHSLELQLPS